MARPNFKTLNQPDLLAYIHAKLAELDRIHNTIGYSIPLQHKTTSELNAAGEEMMSRPDYQWMVLIPWLEDPVQEVRLLAANVIIKHDPERAIPVLKALATDAKGGSASFEAEQTLKWRARRRAAATKGAAS